MSKDTFTITLDGFSGSISFCATTNIFLIKPDNKKEIIKKSSEQRKERAKTKIPGWELAYIPSLKPSRAGKKFYLPRSISRSLTGTHSKNGLPLGVSYCKTRDLYLATSNDENSARKHIGLFLSPKSAHLAYLSFKTEVIKKLAFIHRDNLCPEAFDALVNINLSD